MTQASAAAVRDILNEVAFAAEAHAKAHMVANDTIDTGFALNTIHAIPVGSDGVAGGSERRTSKTGTTVRRDAADLPGTDEDTSAVGVGAEYGLLIELRAPFLYPGAEQAERDLPSIVAATRQRYGLD